MRILHIFDHGLPLQSGYVFRSLGLLSGQRALGWETHHVSSPKQGSDRDDIEIVDGWTYHRTAAPGLSKITGVHELQHMRRVDRRLDTLIEELKPDVLHAHSPLLNGYPAMWAARRHGLPFIYEVRAFWEDAAVDHGTAVAGGARYKLTRALETRLLRRADAVTCICEGLAADIRGRGVPADKITVIPNAVEPALFERRAATDDQTLRHELGLEGKTVLGFVGSFYAYEGLRFLVGCLPDLLEEYPDIRLLLVGGGPEADAIRGDVDALGLGGRVILPGRVPHGEVQRYYDLIDILVYPRLPMRLTDIVTPLKPLEAMASEKIVLASDVGGHLELIEDGKTGYLFKAESRAGLVQGVERALSDAEHWPEVRANGRQFVATERNWQAVCRRYLPVVQRLTGRDVAYAPDGSTPRMA